MTDIQKYVQEQLRAGRKPKQIRAMLVKNGYPVFEIENALAVAETKEETGAKSLEMSPGLLIMGAGIILLIIGLILLITAF